MKIPRQVIWAAFSLMVAWAGYSYFRDKGDVYDSGQTLTLERLQTLIAVETSAIDVASAREAANASDASPASSVDYQRALAKLDDAERAALASGYTRDRIDQARERGENAAK